MAESIYNLIPQPVPEPYKEPMYQSRHAATKPPTFSTFGLTGTSKPGYQNVGGAQAVAKQGHHEYKKGHATFGKLGNAKSPAEYLAKGSGSAAGAGDATMAASTGAFKYSDRRVPPVPTKDEIKAVKELLASTKKEEKNFVTSNAVENILAVPKAPLEGVDWLKKPHFGEVPPYLQKIKQEISDEYEYIKSMQQQQSDEGPPGMRLMTDDEKTDLVVQLKTKWDKVNVAYQSTSVLSLASLDTIGKVKRKEMYEAQLAQIEKDIEKLSKKSVYVQSDEY